MPIRVRYGLPSCNLGTHLKNSNKEKTSYLIHFFSLAKYSLNKFKFTENLTRPTYYRKHYRGLGTDDQARLMFKYL